MKKHNKILALSIMTLAFGALASCSMAKFSAKLSDGGYGGGTSITGDRTGSGDAGYSGDAPDSGPSVAGEGDDIGAPEIGGDTPAPDVSGEGETGVPDDDYSETSDDGDISGEVEPGEGEDGDEPVSNEQIAAGQLTAACYDDNEHYQYWKNLGRKGQDGEIYFNCASSYAFKTYNRIKLQLPKDLDAKVDLYEGGKVTFSTYSLKSGEVYLFAQNEASNYQVKVTYEKNGEKITEDFTVADGDSLRLEGVAQERNKIQVMFVIDYTGSMGDECEYLSAEVNDVITRVASQYSDTDIYTSAIGYKDHGDDFVVKSSQFTTNILKTQNFISANHASGGGDYEEAVDEAMAAAADAQWYGANTTKIIFHIADAPAHDKKVSAWNDAVLKLAAQDVKICTVASSGIDVGCEYLFRSQSILTGGKYIYLTDDSGIGNPHHISNVEEKPTVEYLNSCMARVISGYHTGKFEKAVPYKQENSNYQQ